MMKCAVIRFLSYAEINCRNRRESVGMVAVTSSSPKAVVVASMLC